MISFSQMRTLDIWSARLDEDELMRAIQADVADERELTESHKHHKHRHKQEKRKVKRFATMEKRAGRTDAKAHSRDSLQALPLGPAGRSSTPVVGPALDGRGVAAVRAIPGRVHWHGDPGWDRSAGVLTYNHSKAHVESVRRAALSLGQVGS
jgi:hypothetical protein